MGTWTDEERRENARQIMAGNIDRDPIGQQLTPEARKEAIEFAVNAWKGNMGNGEAVQLGIKHVISKVLKSWK